MSVELEVLRVESDVVCPRARPVGCVYIMTKNQYCLCPNISSVAPGRAPPKELRGVRECENFYVSFLFFCDLRRPRHLTNRSSWANERAQRTPAGPV